jgi:hypothetical protein
MASLAESITAMDEEFEEIKRKAEQGPEQIEQEPAAEQDVAEQPEHDDAPEQEEAAPPEPKEDDAPEAEPAEGDDEPKEAQEAKPGNDPEMARYRKKAEREAEKRAQEMAEKILEQRRAEQAAQAPTSPAEPDKVADPAAWAEWKVQQRLDAELAPYKPYLDEIVQEKHMMRMNRGFSQQEQVFLAQEQVSPKAYNDVIQQMKVSAVRGIMSQHPTITQDQAIQAMNAKMLQAADDYYRAGHNPAQALYERGLSLGFAPQQAAPAAQADKPRASIKNILKNKKPTSSPIAAGGKSGSVALTKEAIERMSALELSQLTPDQCREAGIPVEE